MNMSEARPKKVYSIRGLDEEVYREFTATARQLGKTIGEALSEAMKLYMIVAKGLGEGLQEAMNKLKRAADELRTGMKEALPLIIDGIEELEIGKGDIEAVGKRIVIRNVNRVLIKDDVDPETFSKYIVEISNVEELIAPRTIPKLLLLSKCRRVRRIEVR